MGRALKGRFIVVLIEPVNMAGVELEVGPRFNTVLIIKPLLRHSELLCYDNGVLRIGDMVAPWLALRPTQIKPELGPFGWVFRPMVFLWVC